MCGIAGAIGIAATAETVRDMRRTLGHRGPDDESEVLLELGTACFGAFGHTRLSVLDLSPSGRQPMRSADGRYAITYNGEIYNFRGLRAELQRAGVSFSSTSDTEVLLAGWAAWERALLPRLRGMFAFALWDRQERCVYLCRDRFGMKPLYLARTPAALLFASEVRAILATGLLKRTVSPIGLSKYLAWGACHEPHSMLTGVEMLPAGALARATVDGGRVELEVLSTLPMVGTQPVTESDPVRASTLVHGALRESVRLHMVSDVPIGFFLSGGIDSSALVALAAEEAGELNTFTITFPESEYSEAEPARALAARFRTRHSEIELCASDLLGMLPDALGAMDQPSMDGINTYAVSRVVRERGLKVVLSGLGGDELFAGYPSFRRASRIAPLWRLNGGARRVLASLLRHADRRAVEALAAPDPAAAAFMASRRLFADNEVAALCGLAPPAGMALADANFSLLQKVSWYELSGYMRNVLLRDSDVFSMAHGLELRLPFVDSQVVDAAFSIADSLKLRRGKSKPVLSDAIVDMVPREIWDRPKQGFTFPFASWLRTDLRHEVRGAFTRDRLARVGIDHRAATALWGRYESSSPRLWTRVWALYVLVNWAELHDVAVQPDIFS